MKAKKPILLAVLVAVLLAVALILPPAASGANDNQPVAWVSYGGVSSPHPLFPNALLHQQSLSVHLFGDGRVSGQAALQVIKNPEAPRMIVMAGQDDFISASPLAPNGFTFTAWFDVLLWVPGTNGPTLVEDGAYLTGTYYDGGGHNPDSFSIVGILLGDPLALAGDNVPGNVVVHIK